MIIEYEFVFSYFTSVSCTEGSKPSFGLFYRRSALFLPLPRVVMPSFNRTAVRPCMISCTSYFLLFLLLSLAMKPARISRARLTHSATLPQLQ
jgi:hypothetical protein